MNSVVNRLAGEHDALGERVLDLAVAAEKSLVEPGNARNLEHALKIWRDLSSEVFRHLSLEDEFIQPWVQAHPSVPQQAVKEHAAESDSLRLIGRRISAMAKGREKDPKLAEKLGRAMLAFAELMDELSKSEERRLFPALRHALFKPE